MSVTNAAILKLTVKNHPGVLSHVCGLFARRAYNLEGVMVRPVRDASHLSRMWLLVNEEDRLIQLIRQTEKLADVISVEQHPMKGSAFEATQEYFI
ncbi:acetolactate synthase small subunit [Chromatiales bacterium (ex Bugula neritina AB1)]|nr:acetolactate synthase small subunit [Chromatiales bacterium (ex Bugula neritina AB1)]